MCAFFSAGVWMNLAKCLLHSRCSAVGRRMRFSLFVQNGMLNKISVCLFINHGRVRIIVLQNKSFIIFVMVRTAVAGGEVDMNLRSDVKWFVFLIIFVV